MTFAPQIPAAKPPSSSLDDQQFAALTALLDRYADKLPQEQRRRPEALLALVLNTVATRHVQLIFGKDPVEDPDEVTSALSLLRAARANLETIETALLRAARELDAHGKRLLTFRQIAAALGVESEQAAQGRYHRKVGMPHDGAILDRADRG